MIQTNGPQGHHQPEGPGELAIAVRPERMLASPAGDGMAVTVDEIQDLGSPRHRAAAHRGVYPGAAGGDGPAVLIARVPGGSAIGVGERIRLRSRRDHVHLFSPTTGERLD